MSPRGALAMLCHAPRGRILCKKYHRVHTRAFMSKSYQTHCVCKHFNINTSKIECFFINILQNSCPGVLAEIVRKQSNLKNSVKSSEMMSPRGALAMLCHAPRARIHRKKYHAGDMRARRRERKSKSFHNRRHHRHRRWPCRRCRHPRLALKCPRGVEHALGSSRR